jgi:hypothetical protein
MRRKIALLRTMVWTISFCLILASVSFVPFNSTAAARPGPLVDNNESPEEGARQFDEGVRDVGTILNLDLSTENGVKQAAEIFKRNEKKLANFEKKALHAALRVSSFQKGLKDEAAKRKGGDTELANELESKPGAVGNIPGAEEAAEAIRKSTRPAADTLQRVAEALQKAGDAAKQKNAPGNSHHAKSKKAEPALVVVANTSSNTTPELFCGTYQYICDLLTRVGLFYLRREIAKLQAGTRKANCVVSSFAVYGTCTIARPWDLAYCVSRLSSNVSNCLRYA